MAFWRGVVKILSGVEEVLSSPGDMLYRAKLNRRISLSGKYSVHIPAEYGIKALFAQITYDGVTGSQNIDFIKYETGSLDVWEELSEPEKRYVQGKIGEFILDLTNKHNATLEHFS